MIEVYTDWEVSSEIFRHQSTIILEHNISVGYKYVKYAYCLLNEEPYHVLHLEISKHVK